MDWFEMMRDLKENSGMTTYIIAERSGVPVPTLEKIFSGATRKPGINTVIDIIHAMGGTLDSIDPVAQAKHPAPESEPASSLRTTLLRNFDQLNEDGQERLLDYSDDLVASGKYIKTAPGGNT